MTKTEIKKFAKELANSYRHLLSRTHKAILKREVEALMLKVQASRDADLSPAQVRAKALAILHQAEKEREADVEREGKAE